MPNNPAKYEALIKIYLRSILDTGDYVGTLFVPSCPPSPPRRGLLLRHSPKLSSYSPMKRLVRNRTVRAETKQATATLVKKNNQKQKQTYNMHASHSHTSQENEKKRKYNQRVLDVEMGTFTPLVFGTNGGMGIVRTF